MYTWMYVCVWMYVCILEYIYACILEWTSIGMLVRLILEGLVCTVCMYVCLYVCMGVCGWNFDINSTNGRSSSGSSGVLLSRFSC